MKKTENKRQSVSIVIPVLNEEKSISELIYRLKKSLYRKYEYELIFIDDRSTDKTADVIQEFTKSKKIKYFIKLGAGGKAQSLLEGFSYAKYNLVGMIDSDLQYPPEAIPDMIEKIAQGSDVVIAERNKPKAGRLRNFVSKSFNYIFAQLLHGLSFDVQSGLKVFRKEIFDRININPFPWTFDMEFLLAAQAAGYKITGYDIPFERRKNGESKIHLLKASFQIGFSALLLKLKSNNIIPFHKSKKKSVGPGFHYKGVEFVHFSDLKVADSAVKTFLGHQTLFILAFIGIFVLGLLIQWKITLIIFVALITVMYFIDLLFNFFLIFRSFTKSPEIKVSEKEIASIKEWPRYTIFCPLYQEWAVVPQFVKAMQNMDYPKDKLQVQLLLEEDDVETIEHIKQYDLPSYIEIIVVPDSLPKTKPKACNYGLRKATGQFAVIYDAEDIPDTQQLKKAVIAFNKTPEFIACIQAKLNYYNKGQNLLTRLFTAEYSLWFDLVLTGLQSLHAPIPLGGTSNHFKVDKLREVKGWDSFNVTEDCDLGIRLAKKGYLTAIMDSLTMEEANSDFFNWINQRSRWIKGYMQTYLVHMRDPRELLRPGIRAHFFTFQLVVGGKILSLFINPIMWITTVSYFAMRATLGPAIEELFPGPIFYMGVFSLVFGNFLYMYYYMIGCARRDQYELIKYVYLIPLYWLSMSFAAWKGLIQLIFKPHYWPKTKHGLHLKDSTETYSKLQYQNDIPQPRLTSAIGTRAKKFLVTGGVLVVATALANGLNYVYNGFLSRSIPIEEFGMISLISNFLFLSLIPLEALASTITYKTAYSLGKFQTSITPFWKKVRLISLVVSMVVTALWFISIPWLAPFFKSNTYLPFLLFAPIWIFNTLMAVDVGFLTGNQKFNAIAAIAITEPIVKIIAVYYFVSQGMIEYVYASILISITISSFVAYFFASRIPVKKESKLKKSKQATLSFPGKYMAVAFLSRFSLVSYLTIDILLTKHFLSSAEAGVYALIALTGKMIYFVGSLFNQFIVPIISKEFGENKEKSSFNVLFLAASISTIAAYVVFGLLGPITGPILLGEKIRSVTHLLPYYGLGVASFSVATSIIAYHLVRKDYIFPLVTFALSLVQIGVNYFFHDSVETMVTVMTVIGVLNLVVVLLMHLFEHQLKVVLSNIIDFLTLLRPLPKRINNKKDRLDILIFNWRDTKHVWAGGAEVYIHELAKRIVKKGHRVTIFCGNDGHSKRYEVVDGVQIIRRGGFYTVYIWAFLYYILKLKNKFDVIIDSQNGIPFFTPLYAKPPIVGLMHHVHQEVFRENLAKPLAWIACQLEGRLMPIVYRNITMLTISESTVKAMKRIGLGKTKGIEIVTPGIESVLKTPAQKTNHPSLLYLGRLKPYKSVDVVIKAMKDILHKVPDAKLTIAGFGESRPHLEELAKKLGLEDSIIFAGKVSNEEKAKLLAESWVFAFPSMMEGWGIAAIEANAFATPVVASDVPGLRDSVKNPHSGYLVTYGHVTKFSETLTKIITNTRLRKRLEKSSLKWAKNFSWDKSAEKLLTIINSL